MEHHGLFDSSDQDNYNANQGGQDEYDPRDNQHQHSYQHSYQYDPRDNQPQHSYQYDPRDNQPQHSYQYDPRDEHDNQHGESEARADLDNNLHQPKLQESNQDDPTNVQETPTNVQETPTNVQDPPSKLVVKDTKPSQHNKPKRLRKRNNHGNQRNKSGIKSNMPKKLGRSEKEPSKVQAAQTTSQALNQQALSLDQAPPQLPLIPSPLPTLPQAPTKRKADALKPSNTTSAKPSAKPSNKTSAKTSAKPSAKRANTNVDQPKVELLESRDPATLESRFKGCTIVKDVHVASLVDSGAFGAVFACKTPKGRRIAKVGATPKQLKALVDEFRRYKELSSNKTLVPFLLKTYSLVSFNDLLGNPCRAITMDYGGIDLFAMMKQKGMTALNLRDTKSLCRRVLPALKAFHLSGYVHRDVKPQNILILPAEGSGFSSMSIKLIDFGLVTKWDPKAKVIAKRSLTCGTARFSSWRQQLGYTAHPHDDLESLIYTMVFLLGGKLPWSSAWSDEPAKHLERDSNMSNIKQKANCEMLCFKLDAKRRDHDATTYNASSTPTSTTSTTTTSTTTTSTTTNTSNFARFLQTVRDSTHFDIRNYTTLMDLCA